MSERKTVRRADSRSPYAADCFLAAWIVGMLSAFLRAEPEAAALSCLAGVLLLEKVRRRGLLAAFLGFLAGMGAWHTYNFMLAEPISAMAGQKVRCECRVREVETDRLRVHTVLNGLPAELMWYAADTGLHPGDRVTLLAEFAAVTSEYGTHTAAYEAGHGRYLRIYKAELLGTGRYTGFSPAEMIRQYRARMTRKIQVYLPREEAGLLCAMLFGDKHALERDSQTALYRTGIGHVTAVSGLHLIFFCTVLAGIFSAAGFSRRQVFFLHFPMIAFFILLADSSVSVYRAALMLLLTRAAPLFGRKTVPLRSLLLAMFLCTVSAPYVIGSASFWLSVSGTFGVGVLAPLMTKETKGKRLRAFYALCWVSVAVFPASLLMTGESSLLAPVCNLVILPFGTGALYIGFLLLLTGGATAFLLPAAGVLCRLMLWLAELAARLPFSHIGGQDRFFLAVTFAAAVTLLLAAAAGFPARRLKTLALGLAVLLAGESAFSAYTRRKTLDIYLAGGQKDAAVLITAGGYTLAADLSHGKKNARYLRACCTDAGVPQVDILAVNTVQRASAIQEQLKGISVQSVALKNDRLWNPDAEICGVVPIECGAEPLSIQAGELSAGWYGDALCAVWQGQKIWILPAENAEPVTGDIVLRWGAGQPPEDTCEQQVLTAALGGNIRVYTGGDTAKIEVLG